MAVITLERDAAAAWDFPTPLTAGASGANEADDTPFFFSRLPTLQDFRAITEAEGFVPVPASWFVVAADVTNSTDAIARGRYKDVNTVGAMVITALLNAAPDGADLPFVFGGDGATLVIPPMLRADAHGILRSMEQFARTEFDLHLKTGMVSVQALYGAGVRLQIAKWSVSPLYEQALFSGGGLTLAENWIKHPETAPTGAVIYDDTAGGTPPYTPDYRGYFCRWATIPTPHEENVSLLVRSIRPAEAAQRSVYRSVLDVIERVYGSAAQRHPIAAHQMKLAFSSGDLINEATVHSPPQKRRAFISDLRVQNAATLFFMMKKSVTSAARTGLWFHGVKPDASPMEWEHHKAFIRETSDCQKVDGTLRMIIAGYPHQRKRLERFLQRGLRQKKLVYGLHVADGALMTCLVFQPNGRQVHFVDGANGGYALASRDLKARLATLPLLQNP